MTEPGPQFPAPQPSEQQPPVQQPPVEQPDGRPNGRPPQGQPGVQSSQGRASGERSRTRRTGLLVGLIGGGALLLALIIGSVVWFSVQSNAHSPKAAAAPYLDALAHGDVARAVKLGSIDTSSPLVTRSAYAATKDRITAFGLKTLETNATTATVSVRYTQAGSMHTSSLSLKKVGTDLLFFPKWKLAPVTLPTVRVSIDGPANAPVEVNGARLSVHGDAELDALPGRYDVKLGDSDDFEAQGDSVTVTSLTSVANSTNAVSLKAELTDTGMKAAATAVDDWVDACIAQATYEPEGCSFRLINPYQDIQLSDQKWTLVTRPTFEVGGWDGTGWTVTTQTLGSATYKANATASDGRTGTLVSPSPVSVAVAGEILGFENGKAVFQSIDWSGKAASA